MNYVKSGLRAALFFLGLMISVSVFLFVTTPGLYTVVKLVALSLPGHLNVQRLEGSLINGVTFTDLKYSDAQLNVHVLRANVVWKITTKPWHLELIFNQVHIGKLAILAAPRQSSSLQTADLAVPMPFDIQINQLMMDDLSFMQLQFNQLQLTAAINPMGWFIRDFKAQYANQAILLHAQGQLQQTYPLAAEFDVNPVSPLNSGVAGHMSVSGDTTCLRWHGQLTGRAPILVSGELNNLSQLDTTVSLGKNRLHVTGHLPDQFRINAFIPEPQTIHPVLANIKSTINATGLMNGSQKGELVMTLSPGSIQIPNNSSLPAVAFQEGKAIFSLTPEALVVTSDVILDPNESIKASVRFPQFNWQRVTSLSQSVDGTLSLRVNSLAFLNGVSAFVSNLHGQLSADLSLKGSLAQPDLQGTLKLIDAGVTVPEAGLVLNPIQATLTSHNKHWDVTGSIAAGDGHLMNITGNGEFLPQLMGSVVMNAADFPVLQMPEYTVNISPQLTLKLDQDALDISGIIQVPSARFKPMVFSNTLSLTDDAVFVSHESVNTAPWVRIKADVSVKVGQDVIVDAQGLHGVLGGGIQLIQPLNGSMTALGELTIRNGTYKAYGQNLVINHGQLLFSGATPTNPRVSLRAVRTFNNTSQFSGSNQLFDFNATNLQTIDFGNNVTVGIDVGGYLNDPKIKLFSIPSSLSQADILSMILLGKPASQASQSGGQLLLTAISAMNLGSGAKGMQLLSQIKQTLGLDFDVKSSSINNPAGNKAVGDTAVVVGKALSKRLYLSYSMGILQENSNVLILKYLLNKYFSIQVTASNVENGVDLLYTHSA